MHLSDAATYHRIDNPIFDDSITYDKHLVFETAKNGSIKVIFINRNNSAVRLMRIHNSLAELNKSLSTSGLEYIFRKMSKSELIAAFPFIETAELKPFDDNESRD